MAEQVKQDIPSEPLQWATAINPQRSSTHHAS